MPSFSICYMGVPFPHFKHTCQINYDAYLKLSSLSSQKTHFQK